MPRGGKRQGRTGALYPQRSDLALGPRLPVQAPTGQGYGEAGQQRAAQKLVPLTAAPSPVRSGAASPVAAAPPSTPPPGPLDGPTTRPDEPLTAGSAFGAGPGPEALGVGRDTTADEIRALYMAFPNEDLRALVEALGDR